MMISFIKEKKRSKHTWLCVKIIKENVFAPKPNNWCHSWQQGLQSNGYDN